MEVCPSSLRRVITPLLLGIALSGGCKTGPDYRPPEIVMPDAWHQQLKQGLMEGPTQLQTWWLQFNDPVLNDLISIAREGSFDLKTAGSRILQARALLGIATGERYPQLDASGSYSRSQASENGLLGPLIGDADPVSQYYLGLDSTWELDVFGRIRRSVESSRASLEASIENYRDVLVILYADVAQNYMDVRSLQARIEYALANIKLQQETLRLTEDRYKAELVPELDVQQARFNLANTEALVPDLRSQYAQALNRLSVLLGQSPGLLNVELTQMAPMPRVPEETLIGLPVELLRQRPDIRRAERNLAAQTAQIGVATADLYPSFSLSGTFAMEARNFSDLGSWNSRTWQFGPAFRWNIFDGNRIRSNIKFERARTEEAYLQYRQSVLQALEEVEDAIVSYQEEQIRYAALHRSVVASQKAVELVNELYRDGLTDFQNVLDMERFLSEQQDKLAESNGIVLKNLINIYRAMGGGWAVDQQQKTVQGNQEVGHEAE